MHEIVVNGRFLSRRITGVERHGREILALIGSKCRVEKTRRSGLAGHMWEQFMLPARMHSESILWSPANTGPLAVHHQALTVHDLSPLENPEYFKKSFSTWYRLFLPLLARNVRVVFTPSRYVQSKVMERFGIQNVVVTPNGVNRACFSPDARQTIVDLPSSFILFVGSLQPRKNLPALLQAWSEIREEYPDLWLVIAGGQGSVFKPLKLNIVERVHCLGYVGENDLPGLYAKALLFVLPSLDEGFGLPALEAMACGTPVIVSDGGALPEVVGDAALIFKTSERDSLSGAIRQCLKNKDLSSSLIASGFERVGHFSWQYSAELIWKTLNEI
jgi:glycosyltransferase involved in cell wall biosynthesis